MKYTPLQAAFDSAADEAAYEMTKKGTTIVCQFGPFTFTAWARSDGEADMEVSIDDYEFPLYSGRDYGIDYESLMAWGMGQVLRGIHEGYLKVTRL